MQGNPKLRVGFSEASLHAWVWVVSLMAACVLYICELTVIYKARLVITPGQVVCDSVVLCGHINDRSTTSVIIGKREI